MQISSGKSVHTELIEENGESRYRIKDIIGMYIHTYIHAYTVNPLPSSFGMNGKGLTRQNPCLFPLLRQEGWPWCGES